jgi:hypothetical protein
MIHEQVTPERLMETVDGIFEAWSTLDVGDHAILPSRLLGGPAEPEALRAFTVHELREAERFLLRCGLIRLVSDRHGTRPHGT